MKKWWQERTRKQKNILRTCVCILAAWFCYNYALKQTIQLSADCHALEERIDSAANLQSEIAQLEEELKSADEFSVETTYVTHEELLNTVTGYCAEHSLIIRDYPGELTLNRNEWTAEIHSISVEGKYTGLIQLLEHLHRLKQGKIISATFLSVTDKKTKTKSLIATIYIQTVLKSET